MSELEKKKISGGCLGYKEKKNFGGEKVKQFSSAFLDVTDFGLARRTSCMNPGPSCGGYFKKS